MFVLCCVCLFWYVCFLMFRPIALYKYTMMMIDQMRQHNDRKSVKMTFFVFTCTTETQVRWDGKWKEAKVESTHRIQTSTYVVCYPKAAESLHPRSSLIFLIRMSTSPKISWTCTHVLEKLRVSPKRLIDWSLVYNSTKFGSNPSIIFEICCTQTDTKTGSIIHHTSFTTSWRK